jgi:hypothetical protein
MILMEYHRGTRIATAPRAGFLDDPRAGPYGLTSPSASAMQRRDILKALGAAAALAVLPEHEALAAWARLGAPRGFAGALSDDQLALIGAIADTIIPRTNTPSATDVKVPAFVDVIVSENYTDNQRTAFITALPQLEAALRGADGASFVAMDAEHRAVALGNVERANRQPQPNATYWRLKALVIHGYFTSEIVAKQVLHYDMMPGHYNGAARVRGS